MENGYAKERIWWHRLTFMIVLIAAILHVRTTWRIEEIGVHSAADVHEAVRILTVSKEAVGRAGENSDTLVTQGATLLAKMEALEQRSDRLEAELRTTVQRLETCFTTLDKRSERMEAVFTEFVAWARNPFASLLERKSKEARR